MITYQESKFITNDDGNAIYYAEGVCLSTDTKPTDLANGSRLLEMDTGKVYFFDEECGQWLPFE